MLLNLAPYFVSYEYCKIKISSLMSQLDKINIKQCEFPSKRLRDFLEIATRVTSLVQV